MAGVQGLPGSPIVTRFVVDSRRARPVLVDVGFLAGCGDLQSEPLEIAVPSEGHHAWRKRGIHAALGDFERLGGWIVGV